MRTNPRQAGIFGKFSHGNHASEPLCCRATGDEDFDRPNDLAAAKAGFAGAADEQHFVDVVMEDSAESFEVVAAERA